MSENYIVINGKKAELTPEQLEALGIEVKKPSPFDRAIYGGNYCFITSTGEVSDDVENDHEYDSRKFRNANYCTDKELIQQQAYRETLNRLLWRFSMENGGDKIDWSLRSERKWKIKLDRLHDRWLTEWNIDDYIIGNVYFNTKEVAERAIEEIIKPFMESHPDFKL